MKNFISKTSLACHALQGVKGIVFGCLTALPLSLALAFDGGPTSPPVAGGGMVDPTVGTLPMAGPGAGDFDQTITLRGQTELLRAAVLGADGDGFVEVIDIGDGTAWARFWGDVRIELSTALLPSVAVGLFGGFEGAACTSRSAGSMALARCAAGERLRAPPRGPARSRRPPRQPPAPSRDPPQRREATTTFEMGIDGDSLVIHQDV